MVIDDLKKQAPTTIGEGKIVAETLAKGEIAKLIKGIPTSKQTAAIFHAKMAASLRCGLCPSLLIPFPALLIPFPALLIPFPASLIPLSILLKCRIELSPVSPLQIQNDAHQIRYQPFLHDGSLDHCKIA